MSEKEDQRALEEGRVRVNNYFSTPHVINTVNNHPGLLIQLPIPETYKVANGRKLRPRTLPLARLRRTLRYVWYEMQWTLSRHRIAAYEDLPVERTEPKAWPTLRITDAWVIITGRGERERSPFEDNPDTNVHALTMSALGEGLCSLKTADHTFLEWLLKCAKLEPNLPDRKEEFRVEIVNALVNYLMLRQAGELSGSQGVSHSPATRNPSAKLDSVAVTINCCRDYLIRELMGSLQESQPILGESSRCKERTYRLEMLMALRELLLEVMPTLERLERITSSDIPTSEEQRIAAADDSATPSIEVTPGINDPILLQRIDCVVNEHREMLERLELRYTESELTGSVKGGEAHGDLMMEGFVILVIFTMDADLPSTLHQAA
ncbi:hypothetical protein BV898_14542 [Hypsibius exemplaris]|uniref:Uncharacterized protein n=1 Tax=Hypsibius exemplaris TaxID=2072580 RepID=A0A9X6NC46_HYPEX|nr:hypothetical protein BV898_14542 [Hypsibius exemplaris]